jgi:hypothetical protein
LRCAAPWYAMLGVHADEFLVFRRVSSRRAAHGRGAAGQVAPAPRRACAGRARAEVVAQTARPFPKPSYIICMLLRPVEGRSAPAATVWVPASGGSTHHTPELLDAHSLIAWANGQAYWSEGFLMMSLGQVSCPLVHSSINRTTLSSMEMAGAGGCLGMWG